MSVPRDLRAVQHGFAAPRFLPMSGLRAAPFAALLLAGIAGVFASPARAQFGPPGGIPPYLYVAPEAGAVGSAAAAANNANRNPNCYVQPRGRAAPQEQCEGQPSAEPKK